MKNRAISRMEQKWDFVASSPLMLIQKLEFKIAKDKERLEVHWKK